MSPDNTRRSASRRADCSASCRRSGSRCSTTSFQFYGGETHEERRANYIKAIKALPPGVSQLIIHCGVLDEELRGVTSSAERRDGDRRIFTDPQIATLIDDEGIKLIDWKEYRAMVNPQRAE